MRTEGTEHFVSNDDDPLTMIHFFSPPPEAIDRFVGNWPSITGPAEQAHGLRGMRLLRATTPEAPYPLIGMSGWDNAEAWEVARLTHFARFQTGHGGRPAAPSALYRVSHSTPGPAW